MVFGLGNWICRKSYSEIAVVLVEKISLCDNCVNE
jgi:hypothetical protein